MSSKINFIDLFSGIGGIRIAFESNKCECIFSSEIDENARKTYQNNFKDFPKGDITKIKSEDIPDFNILCAGFPCQPFSIAGKRLGFEDARGTLFFEIARILKDKKPDAFLLENVKGIVNHDSGKTLKTIENILHELNYDFDWKVLNAKDYGVPQNRERWYCVGFNKDKYNDAMKCFKWPKKIILKKDLRNIIESVKDKDYAITNTCKKNIMSNLKKKNIEIDDFSLAYEIRPSRCQFTNNYISPCLTAKMGTGGNNVPVVIKQSRKLTERECLNIMGFPKWYKIGMGYHSYKQIGNSVVVPVITKISKSMVDILQTEKG